MAPQSHGGQAENYVARIVPLKLHGTRYGRMSNQLRLDAAMPPGGIEIGVGLVRGRKKQVLRRLRQARRAMKPTFRFHARKYGMQGADFPLRRSRPKPCWIQL